MQGLQLEDKRSSGFTILEVLIAVAVGSLMMLIVFQMIPALQRTSRNSQRKNDISVILQAISKYELSSSGDLPTSVATPNFHLNASSLTSYATADISFNVYADFSSTPTTSTHNNVATVVINNRQLCDPATVGTATRVGATFRSVVALYALETGGGGATVPQCKEL